jgi:hypothetical protein
MPSIGIRSPVARTARNRSAGWPSSDRLTEREVTAATCVKMAFCPRCSRKLAGECGQRCECGVVRKTRTSRLESGYGKPGISSTCTPVNIDVFTPMPSASVTTATAVKPGFLSSWRKANLRSSSTCGFRFAICDGGPRTAEITWPMPAVRFVAQAPLQGFTSRLSRTLRRGGSAMGLIVPIHGTPASNLTPMTQHELVMRIAALVFV